ncbi:MAG: urease accessory protein UreF [Desulfocurvibacter africanus]
MNPERLLALLHFSSPSLPVGAFAHSQGLAAAVELGWVCNETNLAAWLAGVLEHGLGRLDLPVLLRLHAAVLARDGEALGHWDSLLQASRETSELLLEEKRLGKALLRLLRDQNLLPDFALPAEAGYVTMFAVACAKQGIPALETALGFAWSWLENQVAVACKTIPLGQTAAQRVLLSLSPRVVASAELAQKLKDEELGGTLPGVALASSLHETQYSRMFRS